MRYLVLTGALGIRLSRIMINIDVRLQKARSKPLSNPHPTQLSRWKKGKDTLGKSGG